MHFFTLRSQLLCSFTHTTCSTVIRRYKSHAYVFIALYVGFLVWAVGWECASPF